MAHDNRSDTAVLLHTGNGIVEPLEELVTILPAGHSRRQIALGPRPRHADLP